MNATAFTVGVDNASTTFTGSFYGTGTLEKDGTGTLTMTAASNTTGDTTVADGDLNLPYGDAPLGGADVTISGALTTLKFSGDANTGKTYELDAAAIQVDSGATVTFSGTVSGVSTGFDRGYLVGPGTVATPTPLSSSTGAAFTHMIARSSAVIDSNNPADQFRDFDNSSYLTVAADVNSDGTSTTQNFYDFTNEGAGTVEIGQDAQVNVGNSTGVTGFHSYGVLKLDPGSFDGTSGGYTTLTNLGTSELYLDDGSRTFVSSTTALPVLNAIVDLHGNDAEVLGGLFVNNGYVIDTTSGGHRVVSDAGSLAKGAGFYQTVPQTINNGMFASGNSPGRVTVDSFAFGPDDVSNYNFVISDATGTAGPTPDAVGHVDGWNFINDLGDLAFAADADHKLTVNLQTMLNPATAGDDTPGAMANFDPAQSYRLGGR